MEGAGVSLLQWQEAIVIPILRPGKIPQEPSQLSTDSTARAAFCRTQERVVQSRLIYHKSTVAPVVFQHVFAYHRSQYSRYSAIYTDGSKRADYVGCGVVIEDIMHGYRLDTSCSIFTAEAVAIYRALQLIDSHMPRKYCIYTDNSMSVLEAAKTITIDVIQWFVKYIDITSRLFTGSRYRVLLATKSRRNHRQRASGQRGKVGDDASAASGSRYRI
ncbi:pggt1b [Trichonephila clavipes]|nr:pggt1b [Trichonephila clavipes]